MQGFVGQQLTGPQSASKPHAGSASHEAGANAEQPGSTAAQLIPELVATPGTDVTVFQRTAQWIARASNKSYGEAERERVCGNLVRRAGCVVGDEQGAALDALQRLHGTRCGRVSPENGPVQVEQKAVVTRSEGFHVRPTR